MDKLMKLTEYFKEEGFEDRTITSIMNNFKIKTFKKGECILEVQEHTQYVYFTIEGIARAVRVLENNTEYTTDFYYEGRWCCIYNFLKGYSANIYIEAIEDTVMACISNKDLKKIIINEPECNAFFLKQYSQISDNIMVMIDEFKHFTVNQKRDRFIKLYAPIQKRLEKKYIVSYIGSDN